MGSIRHNHRFAITEILEELDRRSKVSICAGFHEEQADRCIVIILLQFVSRCVHNFDTI